MAPQHLEQKMTMNHEHQQGLDDAEHLTSEPPSASQASPDDLFRYIDQQYAEAKAEFDACEARRKEIVREMAQHMQTLESDDDDDEDDDDSSVYQRHTELTMQLSGIKREQKKLKKKLASISLLADKRKDVETLMRRRISAASSGGANSFSVEELHQIIESQAFATLEVEILNQERNLLEIQLIETKKQTERLLIQCSERDERIKVLKEQNLSYQHEIVRLSQTEAPSVGSQVSSTEIAQLSSLRYNLLAESEHIRKRLTDRTNNLTSLSSLSSASSRPTAPPSTVHTIGATNLESQVSAFTTSSTNIRPTIPHPTVHTIRTTNLESQISGFTTTSAASTTVGRPIVPPPLTVQISQLNQAPTPQITNNKAVPNTMPFNPRGNVGDLDDSERRTISDSERRIDDSERTEEERRDSQKQQHLLDEIAKEQEKALREKRLSQEALEEEERMRIEQQRKRQQQKREQWLRDEAAKEEERKIRELQEQLQAARQAKESNVPIPSEKAITTGRLASIPEGDAKRASMEQQVSTYERQSQSQGDRMASSSVMSPTPSTRRTVAARAALSPTPSTDSSNDSGKNRAYNDMARSAHGGNRVGAMRMKPSGALEEENEDEDDSFSNGDEFVSSTSLIEAISDAYSREAVAQRGSGYTVTATLVEDENENFGMSERERQFEARERELEAREAEIAKQAKSFQSLTAEVVPAAVAVATISRNGSYRTTPAAVGSMESLTNSSGHGSYRTTHSGGAASGDSLNASNRKMGGDASLRELGAGPLRFCPKSERPLREQFNGMADSDYYCYSQLQERWEKKRKEKGGAAYSEKLILRFLYHTCKKDGSFQVAKAWKAMKKTKERNLFLSAAKLEKQLLTATLFPVPGLLSNAGFEMFYMKPCRFHRKDSVRDVIDNLVYVINCMLEKEVNARNGIGFIACMNDWKMSNFEVNYCYQFMMALQAMVVPVTVELFLIVNPPSWFGGIWKIMKPMLAPSFRKKVKVIKEAKLEDYLMEGFENYLPDDLATGTVDTFQLARDFVTFRKHIEKGNSQLNAKSADDDDKSHVSSATDDSRLKTFRSLDSSFRSAGDSEHFGSGWGSSSHEETENDDDDASIHCSIDGSNDDTNSSKASSLRSMMDV